MSSSFLDRYGRGESACHRLPPLLKLLLTLAVILAGLLVPPGDWPALGVLLVVAFVGHTMARIPLRYLLRRLSAFVPVAAALALSFPLSRQFAGGWELATAVFLRSILALMAALWLVNVMPFDQLLTTLRRVRVPAVLVAMLAFMYRYLFVLWDELDRMRTARRARSFGEDGMAHRWKVSGQAVGMLVIRSLDRAERVRGAMCARGWDGRIRTLEEAPDTGVADEMLRRGAVP